MVVCSLNWLESAGASRRSPARPRRSSSLSAPASSCARVVSVPSATTQGTAPLCVSPSLSSCSSPPRRTPPQALSLLRTCTSCPPSPVRPPPRLRLCLRIASATRAADQSVGTCATRRTAVTSATCAPGERAPLWLLAGPTQAPSKRRRTRSTSRPTTLQSSVRVYFCEVVCCCATAAAGVCVVYSV